MYDGQKMILPILLLTKHVIPHLDAEDAVRLSSCSKTLSGISCRSAVWSFDKYLLPHPEGPEGTHKDEASRFDYLTCQKVSRAIGLKVDGIEFPTSWLYCAVCANDLELVKAICAQGIDSAEPGLLILPGACDTRHIVEHAVKTGNLIIVTYLLRANCSFDYRSIVANSEAVRFDAKIFDMLVEANARKGWMNVEELECALTMCMKRFASRGNSSAMKHLRNVIGNVDLSNVLYASILSGNKESTAFLIEECGIHIQRSHVLYGIRYYNNVDLLHYMWSTYYGSDAPDQADVPKLISALHDVTDGGYAFQVYTYILTKCPAVLTENIMDHMASNTDLTQLFVRLHQESGASFTKLAMDLAAQYGNLELVKYIHTKTKVGCTTAALDNAAAHESESDGDVVEYLLTNRSEGFVHAEKHASMRNHVRISKLLKDHGEKKYRRSQKQRMIMCFMGSVLTVMGSVLTRRRFAAKP
jgi:hypothetical protein